MTPTGQIFTTKGFFPLSEVELVEFIFENSNERTVRTDKFLRSTGEWVGNDVHVTLKKGLNFDLIQGTIG